MVGDFQAIFRSNKEENWPQVCFARFVSDSMSKILSKCSHIAMGAAASLEDALWKHKECWSAEV